MTMRAESVSARCRVMQSLSSLHTVLVPALRRMSALSTVAASSTQTHHTPHITHHSSPPATMFAKIRALLVSCLA